MNLKINPKIKPTKKIISIKRYKGTSRE